MTSCPDNACKMGDCTAAENATRHRDHSPIRRSAAAEDETKQMLIVDANFLKGQVVYNLTGWTLEAMREKENSQVQGRLFPHRLKKFIVTIINASDFCSFQPLGDPFDCDHMTNPTI